MTVFVYAVDQPALEPFKMPDRFRHEVTYFMTPGGEPGVPNLSQDEYWILLTQAREWYEGGTFRLISPLDSQNQTECELSEEQEDWLDWMIKNEVQHVRLVSK